MSDEKLNGPEGSTEEVLKQIASGALEQVSRDAAIQVALAQLNGKVDALNENVLGRLRHQESELDRLHTARATDRQKVADIEDRVGQVERFQSRMVGVAVGAGLASSTGTVALIELAQRLG